MCTNGIYQYLSLDYSSACSEVPDSPKELCGAIESCQGKRSKFYCDISGHTLKKTFIGLLQNLENRLQDIDSHVSANSLHVILYFFLKILLLYFSLYTFFFIQSGMGIFLLGRISPHAKIVCFNQDCMLSMLFTQCLNEAAKRVQFVLKTFVLGFRLFDSCRALIHQRLY